MSEATVNSNLNIAVTAMLAEAQTVFTVSDDQEDIKRSADALRLLLRQWQTHDKRVETTIVGLLRLVQGKCDHAGAKRGYNERDGSWMNSCPTCGHSE